MTKYQATQQLPIIERELHQYMGREKYERFERRAKALLEVALPGKPWETHLLELELKQTEQELKSERSRKTRVRSFGGMRGGGSYERKKKKERIEELEKKRDDLMRKLGKEPPKKKTKPKPGKYLYGTHRPIGLAGVPIKYIEDAILEGNPGIERSEIEHYLVEIENPTGYDVWTQFRIRTNYPIPEQKIKEFEFRVVEESR
jgi:hypothetical protein